MLVLVWKFISHICFSALSDEEYIHLVFKCSVNDPRQAVEWMENSLWLSSGTNFSLFLLSNL